MKNSDILFFIVSIIICLISIQVFILKYPQFFLIER